MLTPNFRSLPYIAGLEDNLKGKDVVVDANLDLEPNMLSHAALHMLRGRHGRSQRDARSVQEIVTAAAAQLGSSASAVDSVVQAMSAAECLWAWQLAQADAEDWSRFGASAGLKMAIKAELSNPMRSLTTDTGSSTDAIRSTEQLGGQSAADQLLRRFLLLPEADGTEAKRLSSMRAPFWGLLAIGEDRQQLLLICLEMIALISGLLLPVPLMFIRTASHEPVEKGWGVPPSLADWMDALAAFAFVTLLMATFSAVITSLLVACAGWHGTNTFYARAIDIVVFCEVTMIAFGIMPVGILIFWHMFTAAASPYPLLGAVLWAVIATNLYNVMMNLLVADGCALELYHIPRWVRRSTGILLPQLSSYFGDDVVEKKARARAAALQRLAGLDSTPAAFDS
jgi:hypothetical protein